MWPNQSPYFSFFGIHHCIVWLMQSVQSSVQVSLEGVHRLWEVEFAHYIQTELKPRGVENQKTIFAVQTAIFGVQTAIFSVQTAIFRVACLTVFSTNLKWLTQTHVTSIQSPWFDTNKYSAKEKLNKKHLFALGAVRSRTLATGGLAFVAILPLSFAFDLWKGRKIDT